MLSHAVPSLPRRLVRSERHRRWRGDREHDPDALALAEERHAGRAQGRHVRGDRLHYLDSPRFHVDADAVSNNHFDEDGLVGIFSLIDPLTATRHRALLLDTAQAGDFGVYADRRAARIAFTLAAYANADASPLPGRIFQLPYLEMASSLYGELIGLLPRLLTSLDEFRALVEGRG